MKTIEHRRHTMRTQPGQHLSQPGVELARRVGETMGSFDLVLTSHLPRAFETAIAMGYAVDQQDELLATVPDGFDQIWDAGFDRLTSAIRDEPDGPVATYARALADLHSRIAKSLPDGGRALIVSHGGVVETAAIASVPEFDFDWGDGCDYCEGIRLTIDPNGIMVPELLRVV